MADRMRVTSLMGGTPRRAGPRGRSPPGPFRGLRKRAGPGTSNRVSRLVRSATGETADEYTSRPAASLGLRAGRYDVGEASRKGAGRTEGGKRGRGPIRQVA